MIGEKWCTLKSWVGRTSHDLVSFQIWEWGTEPESDLAENAAAHKSRNIPRSPIVLQDVPDLGKVSFWEHRSRWFGVGVLVEAWAVQQLESLMSN